jgi:hypothetical protein
MDNLTIVIRIHDGIIFLKIRQYRTNQIFLVSQNYEITFTESYSDVENTNFDGHSF